MGKCADGEKYQTGHGNSKTDTMPKIDKDTESACNAVIHSLDHVMYPVKLSEMEDDVSDDNDGEIVQGGVTEKKGEDETNEGGADGGNTDKKDEKVTTDYGYFG